MWASVNFSLLLTVLTPYLCLAYRLRQDVDLANYDDPYSLSNALGAIELQRQLSDTSGDYFYYPRDHLQGSTKLGLYDIPNNPYYIKGYPFHNQEGSRNRNAPQKRTAYKPHRVVPSVDELRKLFSDADLPVKRVAPFRRRIMDKQTDETTMSDKRSIQENLNEMKERRDRLTDKLREMIDKAEKLSKEEIVKEEQTVTKENDPTGKITKTEISESMPLNDGSGSFTEKVVEVFENAMEKNDEKGDKTSEASEENDASDTDLFQEENTKTGELEDLINQYLSNSNAKSKRASSSDIQTVQELLRQIADLKEEISDLQIEKTLEDKENDFLARALKYATLDQLVGGDEFMSKEYDDIVKATETEELLQMLLSGQDVDEGNSAQDENAGQLAAGDNDLGLLEKRRGVDAEGWYDTPITEHVVGGAELHNNVQDKRDPVKNDIGSEFPIAVPYPDDSDETDVQENELVNDGEESDDEDEEAAFKAEEEQKELLHQLLSGLSSQQLQQLMQAYNDQGDIDEDSGVCPAVLELSTNCAFTDKLGIFIDDEARNLCNRHEMCYTCGPDIGLSQERCDEGYRNTVLEDCEGDVRCLRSAIMFLELMQQYHSYSLYGLPQCQQSCVERFIYEGE